MTLAAAESDLLAALSYLPAAGKKTVKHAFDKAVEWHGDQKRETGDLYVFHPIAVARYLTELEADAATLVAALLHDVVEDGRAAMQEVEQLFGKEVAALVDGVTKLSKQRYEGRRHERQVSSLRKMLLTANEDLRVIFVKLADRWHNIQTLSALLEDKRLRIAQETLDIYVPFARIVGWWNLKRELENTCFPLAMPEAYQRWHDAISRERERVQPERAKFVADLNKDTVEGVSAQLDVMTDYQIYDKLQGNLQRLEDVQNIDTVSIVVRGATPPPMQCYHVLGQIHAQYPVQSASFRDYINAPQPNGYRGLHTTIFLSQSHRVRLRIQTESMQEYASRRKLSSWAGDRANDIYKALGSLHASSFNKEDYLSDLQQTVLKQRINVFTPSGEIITLPHGATGVDFAFTMNPDHLSYLKGVRVNGTAYPATQTLNDGETVGLILQSTAEKHPLQNIWVDKVKSTGARDKIRRSLKHRPKQQRLEEGRYLIETESRKYKLPVAPLFRLPYLQRLLTQQLHETSFNEMLERIGSGELSVTNVITTYRELMTATPSWVVRLLQFFRLLPRSRILNRQATVMNIEVRAFDRPGLIHDITKCFADRNINISGFSVFAVPPHDALYKIRLEVASFDDFSNLYDGLLQVPMVHGIWRIQ